MNSHPPTNDPAQATPRTDAEVEKMPVGFPFQLCVVAEFARQLERDLAAARLEVEVKRQALKHELTENNKLVYKAPIGAFEAFVVAQDRRLRSALTGGKGAGG